MRFQLALNVRTLRSYSVLLEAAVRPSINVNIPSP